MPKIEFDYYYGAESEQFSFVRVPRVLFTDKEHFGDLSNDAKLLYGLLLDRMSLSRRNNWFDEQNRVYITVFEASAAMGINPQTFYRHVSELPFPLFKVGRRYRIPKKPFMDYMRSGKTG